MEAQIIEQLGFSDMQDRERRIAVAHFKTFQWIFAPRHLARDKPWSNMVEWLEGAKSIYWMTGKAGSGKSTLMKYICLDSRTRKHLTRWAGSGRHIIARFYFWNSGGPFQMSKEGMLRSILSDALTQVPSLTAAVFPARWQRFRLLGGDVNSWTLSELISAFELLLQQASNKLKICLFIDGLDEFDGDHSDLNDIIRAAVQHPCIKACLASRPWPVFEDAFSTHPSLMLQHLTYSDIVAYSEEKLRSHPGFLALQRQEPYYASRLIESIAVQSDGVFLWVSLVVRSLMTGLSNSDRISDLQRRLEELPSDLEDLYQKMFDSIEPFYVSRAYQLLSLARGGQGSLTALAMSFADEEDATLATKREVTPIEDDEKLNRYESIKRRLNGCCKGFLEIPYLECSGEDMVDDIPAQDEPVVGVTDGIESTARNPPDPVGMASLCLTGSMDPSFPDESSHEDLKYRSDRERQEYAPWVDSHENYVAHEGARHNLPAVFLRNQEPAPVSESLGRIRGLTDRARMAVETEHDAVETEHDAEESREDPIVENITSISTHPADSKVAYLHRTARDFLQSPHVVQATSRGCPRDFSLHLALLRGNLLVLKTTPTLAFGRRLGHNSGWDVLDACMAHASMLEQDLSHFPNLCSLLDVVDSAMAQHNTSQSIQVTQASSNTTHWTAQRPGSHSEIGFLAFAAEYRLQGYITSKIKQGSSIFEVDKKYPLLYYATVEFREYKALQDHSTQFGNYPVPSLSTVRQILQAGADPNEHLQDSAQTVWEGMLANLAATTKSWDLPVEQARIVLHHWISITKEFIQHDADPRINRNSEVGSYIREVFGPLLPEAAKQLEQRLKNSQRKLSGLKRFFIPPKKRPQLGFEDITPLSKLKRFEAMRFSSPSFTEWMQRPKLSLGIDVEEELRLQSIRKKRESQSRDSYNPEQANKRIGPADGAAG